jgi:hypothetical protein
MTWKRGRAVIEQLIAEGRLEAISGAAAAATQLAPQLTLFR